MQYTSYKKHVVDKHLEQAISRKFTFHFGNTSSWFTDKTLDYCRPFESLEDEQAMWNLFILSNKENKSVSCVLVEKYIWLSLVLEGRLAKQMLITDMNELTEMYSFILDELMTCVLNFDPSADSKFSTYFTACCEHRVKNRYRESKQHVHLSNNSSQKINYFLSLELDPECIVKYNADAYRIVEHLNIKELFLNSKIGDLKEYLTTLLYQNAVCSLSGFDKRDGVDDSDSSPADVEDIIVSKFNEDRIRRNSESAEAHRFTNSIKRNINTLANMMADVEFDERKFKKASKSTRESMLQRHKTGIRFLLERSGFHFVDDNSGLIFDGVPSTLDCLGIPLGITRERVRQICQKEKNFIKRHFRSPDAFIQAITGNLDCDKKDFYKRLMK